MKKIELSVNDFKDLKYIYDINLNTEILKIERIFGISKKIKILFLEDYTEFSEILGFNIPIWVTGVSIDNAILVYLKGKSTYYSKKLILHEIIHVLVNDISKGNCPNWLNEGLAIKLSKQYYDMNLSNVKDLNFYDQDYGDLYYEKCYLKLNKILNKYSS